MTHKVAIIGGGITGLSAAYYIQKLAKEHQLDLSMTLMEASPRLGGKIKTVHRDDFVIECGPDSIIKRKTEGYNLIKELHLDHEVVSNQTGKSYILKDGELHSMPEGSVMGVPTKMSPFVTSRLFSFSGKMRAAADLVIPKSHVQDDISVGHFFRRRLGHEVVDHLISPLLSGIYAGDIDNLSLKTTLPQFLQTEQKYGSLIRGLSKGPKPAPKKQGEKKEGQFINLTSGLSSIVKALEQTLSSDVRILKEISVTKITRLENHYVISSDKGVSVSADIIVVAAPHDTAAKILPKATYLTQKNREKSTSVGTVVLAYPKDKVKMQKVGTGFVVSRKEPVSYTATTWTNQKWPHSAPKDVALLRCYVGRAGDDSILHKSDEELVQTVIHDLKKVASIEGKPLFNLVTRWPEAMPQYPVGHQEWIRTLNERLPQDYPDVYLAGSSYRGVGVPDCIKQGKETAETIIQKMTTKTSH